MLEPARGGVISRFNKEARLLCDTRVYILPHHRPPGRDTTRLPCISIPCCAFFVFRFSPGTALQDGAGTGLSFGHFFLFHLFPFLLHKWLALDLRSGQGV